MNCTCTSLSPFSCCPWPWSSCCAEQAHPTADDTSGYCWWPWSDCCSETRRRQRAETRGCCWCPWRFCWCPWSKCCAGPGRAEGGGGVEMGTRGEGEPRMERGGRRERGDGRGGERRGDRPPADRGKGKKPTAATLAAPDPASDSDSVYSHASDSSYWWGRRKKKEEPGDQHVSSPITPKPQLCPVAALKLPYTNHNGLQIPLRPNGLLPLPLVFLLLLFVVAPAPAAPWVLLVAVVFLLLLLLLPTTSSTPSTPPLLLVALLTPAPCGWPWSSCCASNRSRKRIAAISRDLSELQWRLTQLRSGGTGPDPRVEIPRVAREYWALRVRVEGVQREAGEAGRGPGKEGVQVRSLVALMDEVGNRIRRARVAFNVPEGA
ncbi:hypothetical protein EDC01DRAFT_784481 [Geopyxis carbonaria]|nr:hypothetical protein EDC01DRAFT_784481 [Geopyxis carbonaria]